MPLCWQHYWKKTYKWVDRPGYVGWNLEGINLTHIIIEDGHNKLCNRDVHNKELYFLLTKQSG